MIWWGCCCCCCCCCCWLSFEHLCAFFGRKTSFSAHYDGLTVGENIWQLTTGFCLGHHHGESPSTLPAWVVSIHSCLAARYVSAFSQSNSHWHFSSQVLNPRKPALHWNIESLPASKFQKKPTDGQQTTWWRCPCLSVCLSVCLFISIANKERYGGCEYGISSIFCIVPEKRN